MAFTRLASKLKSSVLLLIALANANARSANDQLSHNQFWITVQILSIDWKEQCLTTAYCSEPQLRMIEKNAVNGKQYAASWALDDNFMRQHSQQSLISHWTDAEPGQLDIELEVNGIDPKYGFQRTCDHTNAAKLVQDSHEPNSAQALVADEGRKMIIELSGQCFTAIMTAQTHISRCPWCELQLDQSNIKISLFNWLSLSETMLHVCILILTVICVIMIIASIILCCILKRRQVNKPNHHGKKYSPPPIIKPQFVAITMDQARAKHFTSDSGHHVIHVDGKYENVTPTSGSDGYSSCSSLGLEQQQLEYQKRPA